MILSRRIINLAPSATLAMSSKAQALKAQGHDILSLSVGEPDFPTPAHICEAAKKAIDASFTRYTAEPGIMELRSAVADYFNRFYGTAAKAEHVVITNGGKQALYNFFQAVLNPGDEVLIPTPCWVSYPPMVELAEAKPIMVPAPAEAGFKVTVADLERHCTPKTRAMVFNSPSNPTGACYSQEEIDVIAAWTLKKGIVLISDEIYDQLVYAPAKHGTLATWWQKHPEYFAVTGGASKTFAMTGWRVGHLLAHPELIKAMTRFQGQTTSNVCSVAQKAALAAFTGDFGVLAPMHEAFQRRRDLALDIIGTWKDVFCPTPGGAFYIFPDVHRLYRPEYPNSMALCDQLLEKAGVALVPGEPFGDDKCIRISYAVSDDALAQALERVGKFLFK